MPTVALLLLTALGSSVRLEPATLAFSTSATAAVELVAPHGTVSLRVLTTNGVGEWTAPEPAAPGRFRAQFTFPQVRAPQAALLAVEARDQAGASTRHWVSLPLLAMASLKIETKPWATITVTIGDASFGPANADARGRLTLAANVPPGFASASVKAIDRAGNQTVAPLPLTAVPFTQTAALAVGPATPDQPAELEVFAVDAHGRPLTDAAALGCSAQRGKCGDSSSRAPGVFAVSYRAPAKIDGGPDPVTLTVVGGAPFTLPIRLEAGAPVRVVVQPSAPRYQAGSGETIAVKVTVVDAAGNARTDQPELETDFGTLVAAEGGYALKVPDDFAGRREVKLRARAKGASGELAVALEAGAPVKAELATPGLASAGEPIEARVVVRDAFGNPVDAEQGALSVVTGSGQTAELKPGAAGGYQVELVPEKSTPPGELPLDVRAAGVSLLKKDVSLLPWQRPWAVVVGVTAGGSWNFTQARAFNARLSAGLRVARSPLELVAEGGFGWYPRLETARTLDGLNDAVVDMSAWTVAFGARLQVPVAPRLGLLASATVGAQHTLSTASADGIEPVSDARWGFLLRGGGGVSLYLGIGRVVALVEYGYAPLNEGLVRGNLAGLGLSLGYVASF